MVNETILRRTINKIRYLTGDHKARIVEQSHYGEQLLFQIRFKDETELHDIVTFFDYVERNIEEDNRWYKSNVQVEKPLLKSNYFLLKINLGGN